MITNVDKDIDDSDDDDKDVIDSDDDVIVKEKQQ